MAKDIGRDQPVLGLMDIVVERNAFGRQIDSFEEDLRVDGIADGDQSTASRKTSRWQG